MAHRDFKVDRLVCCNQGSIHTGIVLNPAGPCAVRHGPYGVLDFRVAIGFPSLCQGCGLGRMLACLFFFRYFWSSATALGQRQFKEDLFLGSYGSDSKVHLVGFETSAKFVGGRMLDHFSSTKQPRELRMEEVEQLKRILCMAARILQQF